MADVKDAGKPDDSGASARDILIETASMIMREGDTIDLSFSELSTRSGLNSALVKYYFGNKNGLMVALLERDMQNIVESVAALLAKDIPPDEKLRKHIGACVDTYYAYPYLNRLLMRMVRDAPPDLAAHIANDYLEPISEAYKQLLDEGEKQGLFRPIDLRTFYFAVIGAADRFFTARFVMQYCFDVPEMTEDVRDHYRSNLIDLIMAGVLKK